MSIQDKIKSIFLDYAQGINHLEISIEELNVIAYRIETEVMGIEDPNAFCSLPDLTQTK